MTVNVTVLAQMVGLFLPLAVILPALAVARMRRDGRDVA